MAESPQHPRKIMEHQTRFDVNAAIENWRNDLAAQSALSADDQRELDTHLHDLFVELKSRGLSDEESFVLARHRVGQPQKLADEFVKENPAKLLRERIFWSAAIFLLIHLWSNGSQMLFAICRTFAAPYILKNHHFISPFPDWVRFYLPLPSNIDLYNLLFGTSSMLMFGYLCLLPVIGIALLLSRGRLSRSFSWTQFIFRSRGWFLFISGVVFLLWILFIVNSLLRYENQQNNPTLSAILTANLISLLYPATLVAVIAWLMPTQNQKTPKRA